MGQDFLDKHYYSAFVCFLFCFCSRKEDPFCLETLLPNPFPTSIALFSPGQNKFSLGVYTGVYILCILPPRPPPTFKIYSFPASNNVTCGRIDIFSFYFKTSKRVILPHLYAILSFSPFIYFSAPPFLNFFIQHTPGCILINTPRD